MRFINAEKRLISLSRESFSGTTTSIFLPLTFVFATTPAATSWSTDFLIAPSLTPRNTASDLWVESGVSARATKTLPAALRRLNSLGEE